MNSTVVNKEIKKLVWPILKVAGFATFSSRAAWRHTGSEIDVLEFQSFNKYNADVLGITTFSFAVRLGKFPLYVPPRWPPKTKNGLLLPSESECPFRGSLQCSMQSPAKDKTIWSVDSDGRNLSWCIQDVIKQLPGSLAWFERLNQRGEVARILQEDNETAALWGFGRNPSPIRSYMIGYVALTRGDRKLAEAKLREAVASKCFVTLFASVDGAINRAV